MIPGWLDALQAEVAECLCARGSLSAHELAEWLGVSEAAAVSYITLLASAGRLTIERVSLPAEASRHSDDESGRPGADAQAA